MTPGSVKLSETLSDKMDSAADDLADARLEYAIAESNLAAARSELTRAERKFHEIWGKALCNPAGRSAIGKDGG